MSRYDKKTENKKQHEKAPQPLQRADAMTRGFLEKNAPERAEQNRRHLVEKREEEGQPSATSRAFTEELKGLGAKTQQESRKEEKQAAAQSSAEPVKAKEDPKNTGPDAPKT